MDILWPDIWTAVQEVVIYFVVFIFAPMTLVIATIEGWRLYRQWADYRRQEPTQTWRDHERARDALRPPSRGRWDDDWN